MSEAWEEFARHAGRAETAGYFERNSGYGRGAGSATWFVRADDTRSIGPTTDLGEVARDSDRFLARGGRRAVVGYLGFDAYGRIEPAVARAPADGPFPLGAFAFVTDPRVVPTRAGSIPPRGPPEPDRPRDDTLSGPRFERSVRRLQREIRAGEAFQVVLSHRRTWPRPDDLLEPAGRLRATERFAYFYYLRFGDQEIVGATPESVCEVRDGRAFVNPIAGTSWTEPSGTPRLELEDDPKELAEHRMLVDLARNDLGIVGRPRSVRLVWKERRVRYARLEHLVSRVAADLPLGVGPWAVLRAAFPAGTVSGAPKIRATELLRREEATWRGPYAGAVGLLGSGGRADWALAIRTGFATGPHLYTAAGAGIVHRSRPDREYRETLAKLAHLEGTLLGGTAP